MTLTSLFPDLPMQCTKGRRYSTDRNGRYILQCQKNAGHSGPCDHRWGIDTRADGDRITTFSVDVPGGDAA